MLLSDLIILLIYYFDHGNENDGFQSMQSLPVDSCRVAVFLNFSQCNQYDGSRKIGCTRKSLTLS